MKNLNLTWNKDRGLFYWGRNGLSYQTGVVIGDTHSKTVRMLPINTTGISNAASIHIPVENIPEVVDYLQQVYVDAVNDFKKTIEP